MENLENNQTVSLDKDKEIKQQGNDMPMRKPKRPPQTDIHVHVDSDRPALQTNGYTTFAAIMTVALLGVSAFQAHQTKLLVDENAQLVAKYESVITEQARTNRELVEKYEDALDDVTDDLKAAIDKLGNIAIYSNTQQPVTIIDTPTVTEPIVEPVVEEEKAFLGITVLNDDSAMTLLGLRIADVYEFSPAALAGLKGGDIIMMVDDTSITSFDVLSALIAEKQPGDKIMIRYARTQDNTVYFNDVEVELTSSKNFDLENIPAGDEQP